MNNIHRHPSPFILLLFCATALFGCSGHLMPGPRTPSVVQGDGFVIVTVNDQDTLASLAEYYLGSNDKAGWIAEYNRVDKAVPGQQLVIPQKPIIYGGIQVHGYQNVPVLFYPRIDRDATEPPAVSAGAFEKQMQYLSEGDYVTISLDRLHAFFNLKDQLPPKAIVITFDSAERWIYDIAFPILKRHGHVAAFFVPTEQIGTPGHMQWQELAEMASQGFDIGANGSGARDLTDIPAEKSADIYLKVLEDEIRLSRQLLEDHLKIPCLYFAYPGGQTNDLIIGLLKQYGYRMGFTRQEGNNPFFVHDFKVHRTPVDFQADPIHLKLVTFIPVEVQ